MNIGKIALLIVNFESINPIRLFVILYSFLKKMFIKSYDLYSSFFKREDEKRIILRKKN